MLKKVVASSILMASLVSANYVNADTYEEISCSTDAVFAENSCNQCFDWWVKSENSPIGWFNDIWKNETGLPVFLFAELNEDPISMKGLNWAEWEENKIADKLWELTPDLKKLRDDKDLGYVLPAGQQVNWLQATEGSSYLLKKNPVEKWQNNGLLVYTIKVNPILENGETQTNDVEHRECVLFKSWDAPVTPPTPNEKPKKLPKTWPGQFFLLLLLAMFLAFGILRFKKG